MRDIIIDFIIIVIAMKSFAILEVLVYNPKLISEKKKPIESDIQ